MVAELQHDRLADFVNLTLDKNLKDNWVDISMPFGEYTSQRFIKADEQMSGPRVTWKLQVENQGNAQPSELYAVRNRGRKDMSISASQNWAKVDFGFEYDIDEDEFQGSMERIVRTLDMLEHSAHNDFFELMEEMIWTAPDGSERPRRVCGIPFWVQKDPQGREGRYGGNPAGFAAGAGGVDSDLYERWRNWTATAKALNRTDGLRKWKKMCRRTKFYAPHSFKELVKDDGNGHPYEHWTTEPNIAELEELLEVGNDNTGPDLAKYMDKVLFKGCMVREAEYLSENDPDHPIYSINLKTIKYYGKKGKTLRKIGPTRDNDAPTVFHVDFVHWGQLVCYQRDRNGVLCVDRPAAA